MPSIICPLCRLVNPANSGRCDCGHRFSVGPTITGQADPGQLGSRPARNHWRLAGWCAASLASLLYHPPRTGSLTINILVRIIVGLSAFLIADWWRHKGDMKS